MKKTLYSRLIVCFFALLFPILCLAVPASAADGSLSKDEFLAIVSDAETAGTDAVVEQPVVIAEDTEVSLSGGEIVLKADFAITNNAKVTFRSDVKTEGQVEICTNPGGTVTVASDACLTIQEMGGFNSAGDLNCNGSVVVEADAILAINEGYSFTVNGKLDNYGTVHVGMGNGGKMQINGMVDTWGYICVHPAGTLTLDEGAVMDIQNDENGCGFLQNNGFVRLDGNVNLNGLYASENTSGEKDTGTTVMSGYMTTGENSALTIDDGSNFLDNGSVTAKGEVKIEETGTLWMNENGKFFLEGELDNYGKIHVGMQNGGAMTVDGTVNTNGYICVHPQGMLSFAQTSTLNILNNEKGCGYLDNQGMAWLNGSVKLDGLCSSGNTTDDGSIGGIELWGTMTTGENAFLGLSSGGYFMANGSLTVNGTLEIEPNAAFWVNEGATSTMNGAVSSYGAIHIGEHLGGTLKVNNTLTTYGYLCVHPEGTLIVNEKGRVDVLNNEKYCGFLDNSGKVQNNGTINYAAPAIEEANRASDGKIVLKWYAIPNASKYEVHRATSKSGTYTKVKTTSSTSFTDTDTTAGKTYYYKLRVIATDNSTSDFGSVISRGCDLPQPVIKGTNVSSSGKPKLSWSKISGAEKYYVYRSTSKDGDYDKIGDTTGTSYTDKKATAGKKYYYKVKAIHDNTSYNSAYSEPLAKYCDLAQPEVKGTNVSSSGKPKLSWDKISGAEKYYVYRSTSKSGTYEKIKSTTSTSYTDSSAKAGKKYYYKVKAIDSNTSCNSAYSEPLAKYCDLARPDVSIKLKSGDPKLSWDKVSGAEKYYVYRASSKSGEYKKIKSTTSLSYTDKSAKAGKTYYYKVKAIDSNTSCNSAYSSVDSIKAK